MVSHNILSLSWREVDLMGDCSLEEELVGQSHPQNSDQQLGDSMWTPEGGVCIGTSAT